MEERRDNAGFTPATGDMGRRGFLKAAASSSAAALLPAMATVATASAATRTSSGTLASGQYRSPFPATGYAFNSVGAPLTPFNFQRRAVGANDVVIEIQYCGVCHSDIHTGRGHWGPQRTPQVTGHEIAGRVVAVGNGVSQFKVGDTVGVGCMVNSCGHCGECATGHEQYCESGPTMTYGTEVPSTVEPSGTTQGGYSNAVVVDKDFVIRIPDGYDLAAAGPLMCAAITVYSPLRHWSVRKGSRVGIVGLGGLGHLCVKIAKAMGAEVVVFTTSADKAADAKRFGASDVVVNYDKDKMTAYSRKFDFILNTVPVHHDMNPLIAVLKRDATMCLVGIGDVKFPNELSPFATIGKRNSFAGSMIGGIRETQEVMDFCDLHGIKPEFQIVKPSELNRVWDDVVAKRARYRYVVDMRNV